MSRFLSKIFFLNLLILSLLTMVNTSCVKHDARCTHLMGNGRYCLQPTNSIAAFDVQQKVEARIKSHHETMVTEIEVNAKEMQLVGLTPLGHKLIHISYNNDVAKAIVLPDARLEPTLFIAMIQLAFWPTESVRKGLSAPLRLEESVNNRRYFENDKLVLEVQNMVAENAMNTFHISFPIVGLELEIENLPEVKMEQ